MICWRGLLSLDNISHLKVFTDIQKKVRRKLLSSRSKIMQEQLNREVSFVFKVKDTVMVQVPCVGIQIVS